MTNEPVSKKMKLAENNSEVNSQAEKDTHAAIEKIDAIQSELDVLNDKASEEILQVERKYNKLREPYYTKRATDIATIQAFWVTAFMNHPQISALLTEDDEKALAYMENMSVKENEDLKSGYKMVFSFKENPYFRNKTIEKEVKEEDGVSSGFISKIDWKEGHSMLRFFVWLSNDASSGVGTDELGEMIKDDVWPNPLQYYLATEDGDEEGDEEGVYGEEDWEEDEDEGAPEEEEEEAN